MLSEAFLGLHTLPPKPIVNIIQPQFSSRTLTLFILPKLRLANHQKNFPYLMFKLWNSFINICFTTDILTQSQLLHGKYEKFKKFVKSTLQLSGNLNLNMESISY